MNKKWKNPGQCSEYDGVYQSWANMIKRSGNKNGKNPTYKDVAICDRWKSYDNFFADMADTWFKGASLDKDSIKPGNMIYCKDYCQWMTRSNNSKEMINRLGNPMKNPEVAKKQSISMQGKRKEAIRKQLITKYGNRKLKCLETGEVFDSAVDAAKKYNISRRCAVSDAANPKCSQKSAGGYHWEYVKEE